MKFLTLLFFLLFVSCKQGSQDKELLLSPKEGDYYAVRISDIMELRNDLSLVKSHNEHYAIYKIDTIIDEHIYFKTSKVVTEYMDKILNIDDLSKVEFNEKVRPVRTLSSLLEMDDNNEILFIKRL